MNHSENPEIKQKENEDLQMMAEKILAQHALDGRISNAEERKISMPEDEGEKRVTEADLINNIVNQMDQKKDEMPISEAAAAAEILENPIPN